MLSGNNIMKLKPIKTEQQYEEALKLIDKLVDCEENSEDAELLEHVSILVEAYESEYYPIDDPDPIAVIKFRMEQMGLKPKELEKYVGNKSTVSDLLNKKRPLSLSMIRNLSNGLKISADILVKEYSTI